MYHIHTWKQLARLHRRHFRRGRPNRRHWKTLAQQMRWADACLLAWDQAIYDSRA